MFDVRGALEKKGISRGDFYWTCRKKAFVYLVGRPGAQVRYVACLSELQCQWDHIRSSDDASERKLQRKVPVFTQQS